jgi:molybdate transport system substrate-binding protein
VRRFTVITAGLVAIALAGCSSGNSGSSPTPTSKASSSTASIIVFAASSLTEAFTELGKQFEAAHPGDKVTFSFGSSSDLATEINSGSPADVFASASTTNMQDVVTVGNASSPTNFATNVMEIAVPPSNPGHVTSVNGLAKSSVKVALCQAQVPCGVTAAKVFSNAHISVKPVTLEVDVKSVLAKVELGSVDAGMVYVTDVRAAGSQVKGIEIPASDNASTTYPIAVVSKSTHAAVAQQFVAFVLSPAGQKVLTADGFEKP